MATSKASGKKWWYRHKILILLFGSNTSIDKTGPEHFPGQFNQHQPTLKLDKVSRHFLPIKKLKLMQPAVARTSELKENSSNDPIFLSALSAQVFLLICCHGPYLRMKNTTIALK